MSRTSQAFLWLAACWTGALVLFLSKAGHATDTESVFLVVLIMGGIVGALAIED